jgi:hypothetical protein
MILAEKTFRKALVILSLRYLHLFAARHRNNSLSDPYGPHNQLCQRLSSVRNETMTTLRATGRGLHAFSQCLSPCQDGVEPKVACMAVTRKEKRNMTEQEIMNLYELYYYAAKQKGTKP